MAEEDTAAEKALSDTEFAQQVLKSDKHPEVKQAILEAIGTVAAQDSDFFEAFVQNPLSSGDGLRAIATAKRANVGKIDVAKPW